MIKDFAIVLIASTRIKNKIMLLNSFNKKQFGTYLLYSHTLNMHILINIKYSQKFCKIVKIIFHFVNFLWLLRIKQIIKMLFFIIILLIDLGLI